MKPGLPPLQELTVAQLEDLFSGLGEPSYRARQSFRRIHRHRARDLEEFTELPLGLRRRLDSMGALPRLEVVDRARGEDGTEKVILASCEGGKRREIEAVWIVAPGRSTICVSCQAGCSLDCTFCATGVLPFLGNLAVWEILDQVYCLERLRGERASNVVFMGMGEPFHNYECVLAAAHLLHDPRGAALGARRITISTAGVVPGVERFTRDREPFQLAISLNHPDRWERSGVMPVNRRYPLDELLEAARRYTRTLRRPVTFEYVLMAGINMSSRHLRQLIEIARSVRCKINLIPLNTDLPGLERPSPAAIESFQSQLREAGLDVFYRGSPGREVGGACGMLALRRTTQAGAAESLGVGELSG